MGSLAVSAALLSVLAGVPSAHAAFTPTQDATAVAHAIADHPSFVLDAAFEAVPPNGTTAAVSTDELANFWTSPDTPDFAVLSTGGTDKVSPGTEPAQLARASDNLGGGALRGGAERDVTILRIDLQVPHGASCLRLDYRFLSEESAQGSTTDPPFNDAFVAELDKSEWLALAGDVTAPQTLATTPGTAPVTVLHSQFYMTTAAALGTTFDRATPIWHAWAPVEGGEKRSLYLSIFDTGDAERDSAVFLDHLTFGVNASGQSCDPGPTLVTQVFADAPRSMAGEENGYRILVEAVGGQLPASGSAPSGPLATETITAITDTLAPGFAYVSGSASGATSADPAAGADGELSWPGPLPAPVEGAPEDALELYFRVIVPNEHGTYFNTADVTTDDAYFVLPSGPTAPIEVVPPHADLSVSFEQKPTPAVLDEKLELAFVVTNGGPEPATAVTLDSELPGSLTKSKVSTTQGTCELSESLTCQLGSLAVSESVTITASGVMAGAGLALTASALAAELDLDLDNNTVGGNAKLVAAEGPTPVVGETVATATRKGTVTVKPPDEDEFVELDAATEVPVGSIIDATRGEVKIIVAVDKASDDVQAASFARGKFVVKQKDNGLTTLKLKGGDFSQCTAPRGKGEVAVRETQKFIKDRARRGRRVIRRLWGRGKGRFRTRGRFAAATVRGTVWRTIDRCDGTLIRVKRGVVTVRDVKRKRAVTVRAGERYLVKRRASARKNVTPKITRVRDVASLSSRVHRIERQQNIEGNRRGN